MITNLEILSGSGFLSALLLSFVAISFCKKHVLVVPRKLGAGKDKNVPYLGGLVIFMATIFSLALSLPYRTSDPYLTIHQMTRHTIGIMVSGSVLFVFGLLIDFRKKDTRLIVIGQAIAIVILFIFGVRVRYLSYFPHIESQLLLSFIVTFLWIFIVTNFVRFLDGIDGVIPLVTGVFFATQYLMVHSSTETYTKMLCLILLGVVAGFFLFNLYPARVYLGQNGSSIPGFLLSVVTIVSRQKSFLTLTFILPAFIIIVTLSIILLRFLEREFLFKQRDIR